MNPSVKTALEAARTVSRDFNTEVVQFAKDQALQSLQAIAPANVTIDATEHEPNDDQLTANVVELNKLVKAAIGTPKDADVYTFTTPTQYRDWIRVEMQNRSTTLDPTIELFDVTKASLGSVHNATASGDVNYEFVALTQSQFSARVSSYYSQNTGVYLLRVVAEKAYDAYEPNDDILHAAHIAEAVAIKAKIMDKDDIDYFSVDGSGTDRAMTVTVANNSTTLHPNVVVYNAAKSEIGNAHTATAGGDLTFPFNAKGAIFVRVSDYYNQSPGDYTLTIAPQ
jgi:hypothetical protein